MFGSRRGEGKICLRIILCLFTDQRILASVSGPFSRPMYHVLTLCGCHATLLLKSLKARLSLLRGANGVSF